MGVVNQVKIGQRVHVDLLQNSFFLLIITNINKSQPLMTHLRPAWAL